MASPEDTQPQPSGAKTQSADQIGFLALIHEYQRWLLKICWAYTRSSHDHDDLFQEIVGRLWAAFGNYDRSRRFSTWMYRVALNVAIDFRRARQRRQSETPLSENAFDPPSPRDESKQEQLQELRELLEGLNEADRAVLLLSLEGNTYRDIAEVIGISESNVGTRLNRLKQSLRQTVMASEK